MSGNGVGFRRFFVTRRWTPLAGATLALIAQNLSNGYYLIFFAPFVAAYCVYELLDRRAWTDVRVLAGLAGAALATVVGVLVEVPVMLSVCRMCISTRHWFSASPAG